MTIRSLVTKVTDHDGLNFALTNWIPRRVLTRFIRWFSTIEQPLVRDLSMVTWRFFSDLDLADAQESRFKSVHACFTRKLKEGARPLDPDPSTIVSPCDGIV